MGDGVEVVMEEGYIPGSKIIILTPKCYVYSNCISF